MEKENNSEAHYIKHMDNPGKLLWEHTSLNIVSQPLLFSNTGNDLEN